MISNGGFGFVVPFLELQTKNKSGKAIMKVPEERKLLTALKVPSEEVRKDARLVLASFDGKLLVVKLLDIAEMTKGKGNKLMGLAKDGSVVAAAIVLPKQSLTVNCGRRQLILSPKELSGYAGELGSRGEKLPKGYPSITDLIPT